MPLLVCKRRQHQQRVVFTAEALPVDESTELRETIISFFRALDATGRPPVVGASRPFFPINRDTSAGRPV